MLTNDAKSYDYPALQWWMISLIPLVTFIFMNAVPCSKVIAAPVTPGQSGWVEEHFNIDPAKQPSNATWQKAPHTGVGEIVYTGKTNSWWQPPTVIRTNGSYLHSDTDMTQPFKAAEFYFYAGNVQSGTMLSTLDLVVNIPSLAESFSFELQLSQNNDGTQSVIFTNALADAIININGIDYQLELLGFGDDADNLSDTLTAKIDSVAEADLFFQLKQVVVPLPSTAMLTGGALCFLLIFGRRQAQRT